jgi:hypothetical protein
MGGVTLDHVEIFFPPRGGNVHEARYYLIMHLKKGQDIRKHSGINILARAKKQHT